MRTPCRSTMRTAVTISTPASAASGMRPTSDPPRYTTATQHQRVGDRGEAGAGAGADVHRGAGDRARWPACRRTAARPGWRAPVRTARGRDRGGGGVAHAVGDLRREQALEPGEQRDGERGREQARRAAGRDARQRRCRAAPPGSAPMRVTVMPGDAGDDRGDDDREQRPGKRPVETRRRRPSSRRRAPPGPATTRLPAPPSASPTARHGDRGGVLALGLGNTERGRDLLQEDDRPRCRR